MVIKDKQKISKYYQALLDRKSSFVGVFFVAVKTTSVFCIATCRARKPKLENVIFYSTMKDALNNGYRPCKICKPTENANEMPTMVSRSLQIMKDNPKVRISDQMLKENDLCPVTIRRWFKKHYGLTFQTYQRMYRINTGYLELKEGKKTTDAAFQAGYESLSGFGYTYKKLLGKSPNQSTGKNIIQIKRITTPLGPMFMAATDDGICLLEFVDRKSLETEFTDLQHLLDATILVGENQHITQGVKEINEYFRGLRAVFEVAVHHPGTRFQDKVWKILRKVPFGSTLSYAELAVKTGNGKATRAVAAANGKNRIAIIVPCHRVIGKTGDLTGYGGGIERKRWLIHHEQHFISANNPEHMKVH